MKFLKHATNRDSSLFETLRYGKIGVSLLVRKLIPQRRMSKMPEGDWSGYRIANLRNEMCMLKLGFPGFEGHS